MPIQHGPCFTWPGNNATFSTKKKKKKTEEKKLTKKPEDSHFLGGY